MNVRLHIPTDIKRHMLSFVFCPLNLNQYFETGSTKNKETFVWALQIRSVNKDFQRVCDSMFNEINNLVLKENGYKIESHFIQDSDRKQMTFLKDKCVFSQFFPKRKRMILDLCSRDPHFLSCLSNVSEDLCLHLMQLFYQSKKIAFHKRANIANTNPFPFFEKPTHRIIHAQIQHINSLSKTPQDFVPFSKMAFGQ